MDLREWVVATTISPTHWLDRSMHSHAFHSIHEIAKQTTNCCSFVPLRNQRIQCNKPLSQRLLVKNLFLIGFSFFLIPQQNQNRRTNKRDALVRRKRAAASVANEKSVNEMHATAIWQRAPQAHAPSSMMCLWANTYSESIGSFVRRCCFFSSI